MIKLIGFDIHIRAQREWPFIKWRIGKVHRLSAKETRHEIFPGV